MSTIPQRLAAALNQRYLLEREIGAGGMATVYLARDLRHKRSVALKVVRPELTGREGGERFLREIELAARLQHPHILPVFDSGVVDDGLGPPVPYFVMHRSRAPGTGERGPQWLAGDDYRAAFAPLIGSLPLRSFLVSKAPATYPTKSVISDPCRRGTSGGAQGSEAHFEGRGEAPAKEEGCGGATVARHRS